MTSKIATANRWVFIFFTLQLLLLQFTPRGLHAYFSMYVSQHWLRSGYLLYGALIYLFLSYSLALFRKGQFLAGALQLISCLLLIGVMRYPFTSVNHVALLPFLAALQPIILFCDHHTGDCDDLHHLRETLRGVIGLLVVSPAIFVLMFFPIIEKILIYFVTALLFTALQSKTRNNPGI